MKTYITKTELAQLFLPHIEPHSALNRMMIWIKRNPELMAELHTMGYRPRQKYFTTQQREAIERALVL